MKHSHVLVTYLMLFFVIAVNVPAVNGSEYHSEYSSYEPKKYDYPHHDYHPPAPKKSGHVDINIPLDFGTMAKLGLIGLTQLKLLMALGKVAGAGLGVGALGLGQLGKVALSIAPVHKGGIAIDIGAGGHHHHHHREGKSHGHYEPAEKHLEY